MASAARMRPARRTAVGLWLAAVFTLICGMVVLGGLTRLTGSGLSMVEWRPLMGALPPMSDAEWGRVFGLYQQSPQYELVNQWMDLDAFKEIFLFEYLHRLMGRIIGVAVILPWCFFVIRGWLEPRLARRTGAIILLGASQAGLGWFMVKSGLVDIPQVSHFRLAAHLLLAFFVAMWVLWTALDVLGPPTPVEASARLRKLVWGLVGVTAVQCMYGAFMAGTRAGLLFPTFPDMNGAFSPAPFFDGNMLLDDLVNAPAAIHYVHRVLAWTLLGYAALVTWTLRAARTIALRRAGWALGVVTAAQFTLGVMTVVLSVPVGIATAHQAGAMALLATGVVLAWLVRRPAAADPSLDE